MKRELESGKTLLDVSEEELLASIEGEEFAIPSRDDLNYLQCAEWTEPPYGRVLEYQEGSLDEHYSATERPISIDQMRWAFVRYLRGDPSWKSTFEWEKLDPAGGQT